MKRVSSEEFYGVIGPLDVVLEVREPYPYKTIFKMRRSRQIVGYIDGWYYLNGQEQNSVETEQKADLVDKNI